MDDAAAELCAQCCMSGRDAVNMIHILCNPMLLPECYYEKAKRLCNDKGAKQIIGNDMYLTVSLSEEEFMDIDEKTEAI